MATKYPGILIPQKPSSDPFYSDIFIVPNIPDAFHKIPDYGQANHIYLDDTFTGSGVYKGGLNNHFQGVVRHRDGQHFIFSGGDKRGGYSHLLIAKMESYLSHAGTQAKHKDGPIRSNLISNDGRDKNDKISELFYIDKDYWHAGGLSLMGDILVVPIEKGSKSRIVFIDLSIPDNPKRLADFIDRDNTKAGAATACVLDNGYTLCAVWTEHKGHRLDFYLSKNPGSLGNYSDPISVKLSDFHNKLDEKPRFQTIQFIKDNNGELYILGSDNKRALGGKKNRIFLLHVQLSSTTISSTPSLSAPSIKMFPSKPVIHGRRYYNLNAAGGFYVGDGSHVISMYSTSFFRGGFGGRRINFAEFQPYERLGGPTISNEEDNVIELYTLPNYQGKCLVLQTFRDPVIPDFSKVKVVGKNILKDIESIRYKLTSNKKYTIYEGKDFNQINPTNIDPSKNKLTLKGTGALVEIPNLADPNTPGLKIKRSFDNENSSAQ